MFCFVFKKKKRGISESAIKLIKQVQEEGKQGASVTDKLDMSQMSCGYQKRKKIEKQASTKS